MRKTWVYRFLKFDPVPDRPTVYSHANSTVNLFQTWMLKSPSGIWRITGRMLLCQKLFFLPWCQPIFQVSILLYLPSLFCARLQALEVFLCFSTSRFRLVLMYPSPLCSNSLCFGLGHILVRSAYTVLQQFFFLFRMNAMAHLLQMSSGEAQYPQQYAQILFNEQRSFSSPHWASKWDHWDLLHLHLKIFLQGLFFIILKNCNYLPKTMFGIF